MFCSLDLWNLYSLSIKEELLCRRGKISAFQLTAHIGFLEIAFNKNVLIFVFKGFDNEAINQKNGWNSGSIAGQHQRPGEITIGGKF
jgi:hypothetical protein